MTVTETWRAVPGYEGRYEVSDLGRVRALRFRTGICDRLRDEPLVLRTCPRRGYQCVTIDRKKRSVHLLVLEAFAGSCPPGMLGTHRNGVPEDNRLENLRWATHAENMQDRALHGRTASGERHGSRTHPEKWLSRRVRGAA